MTSINQRVGVADVKSFVLGVLAKRPELVTGDKNTPVLRKEFWQETPKAPKNKKAPSESQEVVISEVARLKYKLRTMEQDYENAKRLAKLFKDSPDAELYVREENRLREGIEQCKASLQQAEVCLKGE